jgi:hypothetical protein
VLAKTLAILGGEVVTEEEETINNFGSPLASRVLNKALNLAIGRDQARARTRIFPWRVEPNLDFDTRHELGLSWS